MPLSILAKSRERFGISFDQLVNNDGNLKTCDEAAIDWSNPASALLQGRKCFI